MPSSSEAFYKKYVNYPVPYRATAWANSSLGFPYISCALAPYGTVVDLLGFDWKSYRYDYSH